MSTEAWIAVSGLALTVLGQAVLLIYAGTKAGTKIKMMVESLIEVVGKLESAVDRLEKAVSHLDRRVTVLEDRHDRTEVGG